MHDEGKGQSKGQGEEGREEGLLMTDAANWIGLGCVGGALIVCGLALYLLLFGWRSVVDVARRWIDQK